MLIPISNEIIAKFPIKKTVSSFPYRLG